MHLWLTRLLFIFPDEGAPAALRLWILSRMNRLDGQLKNTVCLDILCCEPSASGNVCTEFTRFARFTSGKTPLKLGLGAKSRRGDCSCKVGVGRMPDLRRKKSAGSRAADARNEVS